MKAKFLQFISQLNAALAEMQARANEQIKNLPPVEQHEAAAMITSFKAELGWMTRRIEDLSNSEVIAKADEIIAGIQKEGLQESIQAGELLEKQQHDTLIEAAREGAKALGRTEAKNEIIAEQQRTNLIATRRAEVDGILGAEHGIEIPEDRLVGENYDTFLASLRDAVDSATQNGFTLDKTRKCFSSIVTAAFHGREAMTDMIASLADARGIKPEDAGSSAGSAPKNDFVASRKRDGDEATGFTFVKPY